MGFKEQIALDAAIFLDEEEFGDPVTIDGLSGTGSWEPIDQEPGALDGYAATTTRWFVIVPGLALPVPDQQLTVNDQTVTVDSAIIQGGIMEITTSRYSA